MANLSGFDATTVEPARGFDPLPVGDYKVVITSSEMKPTKAGTGQYLKLEMEVIEGQYKGRKLWNNLNLNNPNQTAVEIARAELSAICRAVGVMRPNDSVELHNLPFIAKVGCKKRADNGEMENVYKGFEPISSQQQAAAATGGDAPWRR